jgi:serine/threonine protein kinase
MFQFRRAVKIFHQPAMLELELSHILSGLGPVLGASSQGLVQQYEDKYVVKFRDKPKDVRREVELMTVAGNVSVEVIGIVYTGEGTNLEGFVMPLLAPVQPANMNLQEKLELFQQMRVTIQTLHQRGVIHGDVNLSNMLLDDRNRFKLCDFGTSAYVPESYCPKAFTLRSSSPYRLRKATNPPLIPEEDEYALGIAVWELFTEKRAFAEIDNEDDLEDAIKAGRKVDIDCVEVAEVREFIRKCLDVFEE